jgi:hypothetical protein
MRYPSEAREACCARACTTSKTQPIVGVCRASAVADRRKHSQTFHHEWEVLGLVFPAVNRPALYIRTPPPTAQLQDWGAFPASHARNDLIGYFQTRSEYLSFDPYTSAAQEHTSREMLQEPMVQNSRFTRSSRDRARPLTLGVGQFEPANPGKFALYQRSQRLYVFSLEKEQAKKPYFCSFS